jgi:hypothetical protein
VGRNMDPNNTWQDPMDMGGSRRSLTFFLLPLWEKVAQSAG